MNTSINTSLIPSLNTMQQATSGAGSVPDGTDFPSTATPPPAVATILESIGIKVTFDKNKEKENNNIVVNKFKIDNGKSFYKCISLKCKSWFCETCRMAKGLQLRERILNKAELFKVPKLYTLTVNREWFESPKAAYEYVMGNKFIARLLTKELKVKRWFWVLEPQEANGDGWPHWHLLIDVGDLAGTWYHKETKTTADTKPENIKGWCYVPNFFDLNKVHRLLLKWKVGKQCKLTKRKDKFNNPVHAIRYITKYLIKMPPRGFPPWMLNYPRLRFYQPSYEVGSLGGVTVKKKETEIEPRPKKTDRKPVDRVSECNKQVIFMNYDHKQDKNIFTHPVWAIKESIECSPGAIKRKDFSFVTLKEYDIWGFDNLSNLHKFIDIWKEPDFQHQLKNKIIEKRKRLLEQWNNTANDRMGDI
jgi:hypothetical protein